VSDRLDDLAARDEILQVMYWLRGERIADAPTAEEIGRMATTVDASALETLLIRLAGQGYVERVSTEPSRYRLTDLGVHEGGRRFADEFAALTKPGHGECGDPDCDCQRTGSPDDCRHRHVS